jgi:hypothetical protein
LTKKTIFYEKQNRWSAVFKQFLRPTVGFFYQPKDFFFSYDFPAILTSPGANIEALFLCGTENFLHLSDVRPLNIFLNFLNLPVFIFF